LDCIIKLYERKRYTADWEEKQSISLYDENADLRVFLEDYITGDRFPDDATATYGEVQDFGGWEMQIVSGRPEPVTGDVRADLVHVDSQFNELETVRSLYWHADTFAFTDQPPAD
jgi:hypothetical protein